MTTKGTVITCRFAHTLWALVVPALVFDRAGAAFWPSDFLRNLHASRCNGRQRARRRGIGGNSRRRAAKWKHS